MKRAATTDGNSPVELPTPAGPPLSEAAPPRPPVRVVFTTFGDSRMSEAAGRIRRQAEEMRIYDEILVLNEKSLGPDFPADLRERLTFGSRGFGYWCWKPYVVLSGLGRMRLGDILHYADMGCHLNPSGRPRFLEYLAMVSEHPSGLLVFGRNSPERQLAKGDLLDYFQARGEVGIVDSAQVRAGTMLIRRTPENIRLAQEWLGVFERDFSLADDTPSRSPNLPGFKGNKHDQSAFSILAKRRNALILPSGEVIPRGKTSRKRDWGAMAAYPVHFRRDHGLERTMKAKAARLVIRLLCASIPFRDRRRAVRNRLLNRWEGFGQPESP